MMPNYSLLLRKPPPTTKGQSSMETVLETLPNVSESVNFATMSIVLTGNYTDKVTLQTVKVANNGRLFREPNLLFCLDRFTWVITLMKDLMRPLRSKSLRTFRQSCPNSAKRLLRETGRVIPPTSTWTRLRWRTALQSKDPFRP